MEKFELMLKVETAGSKMKLSMAEEGDPLTLEVAIFSTISEYFERLRNNEPVDEEDVKHIHLFLHIGKAVLVAAADYIKEDDPRDYMQKELQEVGNSLIDLYNRIYG